MAQLLRVLTAPSEDQGYIQGLQTNTYNPSSMGSYTHTHN